MVRREGRPRRAAQARKQGPDRKSLVKYVERQEKVESSLCKVAWFAASRMAPVFFFQIPSTSSERLRVTLS